MVAVDLGDMGGLMIGAGGQTWSPSSDIGTGWLQVEHLTVGRIWESLAFSGGGGISREAIMRVVVSEWRGRS